MEYNPDDFKLHACNNHSTGWHYSIESPSNSSYSAFIFNKKAKYISLLEFIEKTLALSFILIHFNIKNFIIWSGVKKSSLSHWHRFPANPESQTQWILWFAFGLKHCAFWKQGLMSSGQWSCSKTTKIEGNNIILQSPIILSDWF